MTANGTSITAAPRLKSLPGRTAKNVSRADAAAARVAATSPAATSPESGAAKAPTPFSDLLTAMIEAHAAESGRARQHAGATGRTDAIRADATDVQGSRWHEVDADPPAANQGWRVHSLNAAIAGLIVAIGAVVYVAEIGNGQPPAVAADEERQASAGIAGNATATDKPVERPVQTGEPGGWGPIRAEEERTPEGETGTGGASVAQSDVRTVAVPEVGPIEKPAPGMENGDDQTAETTTSSEAARTEPIDPAVNADDRTVATAVAGQPVEKPASAAENRADETAEAATSSGAARAEPIDPAVNKNDRAVATAVAGQPVENPASDTENRAGDAAEAATSSEAAPAVAAGERSPPPDAASSPPAARGTGSIDRANDPVATHLAQATSDVNMRAGPSNSQSVLTTIPQGSPVQVIECRQWCEVIFAGRRGWVYKRFIGGLPSSARR